MKWLALIVFGGTGFAVLVAGVVWALNRYPLYQNGGRAKGKVVEQIVKGEAKPSGEDSEESTPRTYAPLVEYTTEDGRTIRFEGSVAGSGTPAIETGTEVEVIYDRRNPSNAQIGTFRQFWMGPVATTIIGLIFFSMGVASFFLIRQSDRVFGPEFDARMRRDMLVLNPDAIRFEARVREVRPCREGEGKGWVLVCSGLKPGKTFEDEFLSDTFPFEPGWGCIGQTVKVFVDPKDEKVYTVDLGPHLQEILDARDK